MGIKLFPHNEAAYRNASAMLSRTGRAAVIHPTGTGKSFIAFHLIEEEPDTRFLWLSPSEYIFRTQLESLLSQDPAYPVGQITFLTYARLAALSEEELSSLQPEVIILDEFHRCGAKEWGKGLKRLMDCHPQAKILGLSATAVRYLDNNRDMAEELFDQNVASEMTLGEAIVRGILRAPVYISAIYDYGAELKKYESRIRSMRGRGLEEANRRYLEALRRTLERSEGLDRIFERYLPDKNGKYIVFCANVQHLKQMQQSAKKWFRRIDAAPHLYTVYADSAAAAKEYTQFLSDESPHLKLLYCIDMLNEGVHVKGISGVILFRPTVSPIIYKQQIGRALTAGEEKTPLIIDVVNNAASLCSIDFIREEMGEAVWRLRENGESDAIVTETFEVTEQVEDCRKLFAQLEAGLSSGWEQYYQAAAAFSKAHGNSLVELPRRYVSPEGLSVGNWVETQRLVRAGKQSGTLTDTQIHRLDAIGMVWENRREALFEKKYQYAVSYYKEHGDLLVGSGYRTEDGFCLGGWINGLRQRYAAGDRSGILDEEHRRRLEEIGMCWSASDVLWEKNYKEALTWYASHGTIADVPVKYYTENGFALGAWLSNLRSSYRKKDGKRALTDEQIRRLDAIGMRWTNLFDEKWMEYYQAAKQYQEQHGSGSLQRIPSSYKTSEGLALGKWIAGQQEALRHPEDTSRALNEDRIRLLRKLGICREDLADSWTKNFEVLKRYQQVHHSLDLSQDTICEGVWVGKWLSLQKKAHEEGKLSSERSALLESIGYDWMTRSERQWQTRLEEAENYYKNNGHLQVGQDNRSLGRWLHRQSVRRSKGQLKPGQIRLLEQTGMVWQ